MNHLSLSLFMATSSRPGRTSSLWPGSFFTATDDIMRLAEVLLEKELEHEFAVSCGIELP